MAGPIGFGFHGHTANRSIFNPNGFVFVSNIAVGIEVGFFDRIKRGIMPPPRKRCIGKHLSAVLRVRERRATNPWAAVFGFHIAVSIKHSLPAMSESRLQIIIWVQAVQIGGLRHDIEHPTKIFDLHILYRVQQVLHQIDIVGGDGAGVRNLTARIGIE